MTTHSLFYYLTQIAVRRILSVVPKHHLPYCNTPFTFSVLLCASYHTDSVFKFVYFLKNYFILYIQSKYQ